MSGCGDAHRAAGSRNDSCAYRSNGVSTPQSVSLGCFAWPGGPHVPVPCFPVFALLDVWYAHLRVQGNIEKSFARDNWSCSEACSSARQSCLGCWRWHEVRVLGAVGLCGLPQTVPEEPAEGIPADQAHVRSHPGHCGPGAHDQA